MTFFDWLKRHQYDDSPLGDLASDTMRSPGAAGVPNTIDMWVMFVENGGGDAVVIRVLRQAWRSYQAYLRRHPELSAERTDS